VNKNSYLIQLSASKNTDFGRVDFSKQSEVQKVFSAIWALESQVNNGGFLQYFACGDGETANFAPTALRSIGAMRCASIVAQALAAVSPDPLPDSREARVYMVNSLSKSTRKDVEKLDSQFFAYPDNLTELLFDYVSAHSEAFGSVR
jgi:hypothetical protein